MIQVPGKTSPETLSLLERYQAGDNLAAEALLVEFLPMVASIAKRILGRTATNAVVDHDELMQAGSIGFIQAVGRYRPNMGVKLSSFAHHRIRGAMIDALRGADFVSKEARRDGSGTQCVNTDWGCSANSHRHPATHIDFTSLLHGDDWWASALRGLSRSERLAVEHYFRHGRRMQEVGDEMGLSESRASQLVTTALEFLRQRTDRPWSEFKGTPEPIDSPPLTSPDGNNKDFLSRGNS